MLVYQIYIEKVIINYNIIIFFNFIEDHKNGSTQKNKKLYKSGSLSEFYNNKSVKSFKNTGNNNYIFNITKK